VLGQNFVSVPSPYEGDFCSTEPKQDVSTAPRPDLYFLTKRSRGKGRNPEERVLCSCSVVSERVRGREPGTNRNCCFGGGGGGGCREKVTNPKLSWVLVPVKTFVLEIFFPAMFSDAYCMIRHMIRFGAVKIGMKCKNLSNFAALTPRAPVSELGVAVVFRRRVTGSWTHTFASILWSSYEVYWPCHMVVAHSEFTVCFVR
jgi:hypothetical protein